MGFADVHAHLTHPKLLPRCDEIIDNARVAGVTSIICNGLNPADNQRVMDLAARFAEVRPAFGFYPVDTVLPAMLEAGVEYPRDDEDQLCSAEQGIAWVAEHAEQAFAIGEIGLDGYWVPAEFWPAQEEVFRALVALAMDHDKVVIIHTRKREKRALEILLEMGARKVLWHCFGSKVKLARVIAEHGHYLSVPANARRAESFTRMLEKLPRDRLLLETDCPYLGPDKTKDNEPANVALTGQYAAELWKCPGDDVLLQVSENFTRLFGVEP